MRRVRLGLQAALVIGLFLLVSSPGQRALRTSTPWQPASARTAVPASGSTTLARAATGIADAYQPADGLAVVVGRVSTPLEPIPYARLLLRDAETGAAAARTTADAAGAFTFSDVRPNGYIVEALGPDDAVQATSEFVSMRTGEVREVVVRVPGDAAFLSAFGAPGGSAGDIVDAAANDGVGRVAPPPASISPQR